MTDINFYFININMYYVICSSEGEGNIEKLTEGELLKRINPDEDGFIDYGDYNILQGIRENNISYWNNELIIIKGEIVVPKPVEIIKSFIL